MSNQIVLTDTYPPRGHGARKYQGELEFIIKDKYGKVLDVQRDPNIIKIPAKEIFSHRLAPRNIWDPLANSGQGAWVSSGLDPRNEFAPRYFLFGASFDANGAPLTGIDTRYYTTDPVTGAQVPITLGAGAEYNNNLINPVPISEPQRPLKRAERLYFEPSYQPAGSPLLQPDILAVNNVLVVESTLQQTEYNGFGQTPSDYFIITEAALVAAVEVNQVGACECSPRSIFSQGSTLHPGKAILTLATSSATVNLDPSEAASVNNILEGDQVMLIQAGAKIDDPNKLGQITPFYLVVGKSPGSMSIILDRTPVTSAGVPLSGQIGLFRYSMRIFAHRILRSPIRKTADIIVTARWRIIMA